MAFRDQNNVGLFVGDVVEKDDRKYIVRAIKSYSFATVAIVENLVTKDVETFHLRDIIKIRT
jgi:hypothetical protein